MNTFKSQNGKYLVFSDKTLGSDCVHIAKEIDTDKEVVVKIIKKLASKEKELLIQKKGISHPGIIQYVDIDTIFSTTFIFMPKYDMNLQRYMVEKKVWSIGFSEDIAFDIFKKLYSSISFLHQYKIAHRDIKLENFLVNLSGDSFSDIVLADFGLSYDWEVRSEITNHFEVGTPAYMAPELVTLTEYKVWKPDIWALGICLYLLTYGRFPFWGKSKGELYVFVRALKYDIPFETKNTPLIKEMLSKYKNRIEKIDI